MPADRELLSAAIRAAVEQVLETMFYTEAFAADAQPADALCAHLHFNGDPSGEFELVLARGAARKLAASYLGLPESDLGAAAEADVSCELANMICGATLSRVHPDSIVKLNSPELAEPTLAGDRQCFETPEGLLSVCLRVN